MNGSELLAKYELLDDRAKHMVDALVNSQLRYAPEAPKTAYYKVLDGEANNSSKGTE